MRRAAEAGASWSRGGTEDGRDSVRILVAADNEVLRAGIATLIRLHPDFAVSEVLSSPVALIEEAQARRPDVLLVDIAMAESLRRFLDARRQGAVSDIAVVAFASDDLPDIDVLRNLVKWGLTGSSPRTIRHRNCVARCEPYDEDNVGLAPLWAAVSSGTSSRSRQVAQLLQVGPASHT
jgi:DNA-binding NarL/FixJ family response regulator